MTNFELVAAKVSSIVITISTEIPAEKNTIEKLEEWVGSVGANPYVAAGKFVLECMTAVSNANFQNEVRYNFERMEKKLIELEKRINDILKQIEALPGEFIREMDIRDDPAPLRVPGVM